MKRIPINSILCLVFLIIVQFGACSTVVIKPAPNWTQETSAKTSEGMSFIGISYPLDDERSAREDAILNALNHTLRYAGMEIDYYAKVLSRESGHGSDSVSQYTQEDMAQIASAGFLKNAKISQWYISNNHENKIIAYVKVIVPYLEINRLEKAQEERQELKIRPYREAMTQFEMAIEKHEIAKAISLVDQVLEAAKGSSTLGSSIPISKNNLLGRIFAGINLSCPESIIKFNNNNRNETANIRLSHYDHPVGGVMYSMTVPSGIMVDAVSDSDGMLKFKIPFPAHPGEYPVSFIPKGIYDSEDARFKTNLVLKVSGRDNLAAGMFHDYIEASGFSSLIFHNSSDITQTKIMALKTAKHLAYGDLLQKRDGIKMAIKESYSSGHFQGEINSRSSGKVIAEVVSETTNVINGEVSATVTLRSRNL